MNRFKHWSPRYLYNRINEMLWRKLNPGYPWLTPAANKILDCLLKPSDTGIEFGSGVSTVYFAKKTRKLISIEHDEFWFNKVRRMLEENSINNVELFYIPRSKPEEFYDQNDLPDYAKILHEFEEQSIDFILIDGIYRDLCALHSIKVVRSGGFLIIDNINWFIPNKSNSPSSRRNDFASEIWKQVWDIIKSWRYIWTTSGVTDTAIFFKP